MVDEGGHETRAAVVEALEVVECRCYTVQMKAGWRLQLDESKAGRQRRALEFARGRRKAIQDLDASALAEDRAEAYAAENTLFVELLLISADVYLEQLIGWMIAHCRRELQIYGRRDLRLIHVTVVLFLQLQQHRGSSQEVATQRLLQPHTKSFDIHKYVDIH